MSRKLKKMHRKLGSGTSLKAWARSVARLTFHDDYEVFRAIGWAKTWLGNKRDNRTLFVR